MQASQRSEPQYELGANNVVVPLPVMVSPRESQVARHVGLFHMQWRRRKFMTNGKVGRRERAQGECVTSDSSDPLETILVLDNVDSGCWCVPCLCYDGDAGFRHGFSGAPLAPMMFSQAWVCEHTNNRLPMVLQTWQTRTLRNNAALQGSKARTIHNGWIQGGSPTLGGAN